MTASALFIARRDEVAKVKCKNCKIHIDRDGSVRIGLSSFCDFDCYSSHLAKAAESKPEKISSSPPEWSRERVLKEDNFRCRMCGKKSGNLIFHHIRYKSEMKLKPDELHLPSNGIPLCNEPCHLSIVHKNKKKYQPLCLKIVELREAGDRFTLIKNMTGDDS